MKKNEDLVYMPVAYVERAGKEVRVEECGCWPAEVMYISRNGSRIDMKMTHEIVIESFIWKEVSNWLVT